MAGTSPIIGNSVVQRLPTPSPYSFSITSTGWRSRPPMQLSDLFIRFLALVLSFVSALALATQQYKKVQSPSSFADNPDYMYCFIVSIMAFVYSAFQLFKGVCDISHGGVLISNRISDYLSFILDQMVAYLLISSSSVGIQAIRLTDRATALWRAAIVSITVSFVIFLVMAACALLSGYKLCKRIVW